MKPRYKTYLKLNLMSVFFIVVSFISITLAWFAYSGLAKVSTEVNVKAWYIELEKGGQTASNDIVISLTDLYPGMDIVDEIVNIKNLGDSDAQVKYSIVSARILDKVEDNYLVDDETTTSPYVEDKISHEYPFHININLSKGYVLSKKEDSSFEVSISWPLDSDHDALDSLWGTAAYEFQEAEQEKKNTNPDYQIKPSIQIVISVIAEQYLEIDTASDPNYNLGDIILFDIVNNQSCSEISSTCLKTYVMDVNNTLGDNTVTLLPEPMNTYATGTFLDYNTVLASSTNGWTASTRPLMVSDLLKVIATDVTKSHLIIEGLSNQIIGNLNYENRMNTEIARTVNSNGHYGFVNTRFGNFASVNCYWTSDEYNSDNGFAVKKIDDNTSKVYGEMKTSSCNVIPIIIANKADL